MHQLAKAECNGRPERRKCLILISNRAFCLRSCTSLGYKRLSWLGLRPHALQALGKDAFRPVLLQGRPNVVSPNYFSNLSPFWVPMVAFG